jgi:hypothetical protein
MTHARPSDYEEQAEELLPWAVTDDDALTYRRDQVAKALADAWNRGYKQGGEDR